jgi:Flp pilus assembly protein protease CpaA
MKTPTMVIGARASCFRQTAVGIIVYATGVVWGGDVRLASMLALQVGDAPQVP